MAKKTVKKKGDKCEVNSHCCKGFLMGISSLAFILFVIRAWPSAMNLVNKVHWMYFLGVAVLFFLLHIPKCSCKK